MGQFYKFRFDAVSVYSCGQAVLLSALTYLLFCWLQTSSAAGMDSVYEVLSKPPLERTEEDIGNEMLKIRKRCDRCQGGGEGGGGRGTRIAD